MTLLPFGILALINFLFDPLHLFRKSWGTSPVYYYDERFKVPGLVRQSFPTEIVVGPSTAQPFYAKVLKAAGKPKALNAAMSAATIYEQRLTVEMAKTHSAVKRIFWGIEWITFSYPTDKVTDRFNVFPHHLYKGRGLDVFFYLLSTQTLELSLQSWRFKKNGEYGHFWSYEPEVTKVASTNREYSVHAAIKDYFAVKNSDEVSKSWTEKSNINLFSKNFEINLKQVVENNPDIQFDLIVFPNTILQTMLLKDDWPDLWTSFSMINRRLNDLAKLDNVTVHNLYAATEYYMDLSRYRDIQHFNTKTALNILRDVELKKYVGIDHNAVHHKLLTNIKSFQVYCSERSLRAILEKQETLDAANCNQYIESFALDNSSFQEK